MWPFARRRKAVDPGRPHPFTRHDARGLGALASTGEGGFGGAGNLGFTSSYLREDDRCDVPGCGRGRDDDLHAAAS